MLEAGAPRARARAAGRRRAAVHRLRGERAARAPRRSTRGACAAAFGYVFDHASPIGEIVVASPTYYRIEAEFHGAAAHAGIRPEDGRSAIVAAARAIAAMPLGRLDDETTANVGTIDGGAGSTNVVPERCRLEAEARSLDDERGRRGDRRDRRPPSTDGANAAECDVDCRRRAPLRRLPHARLGAGGRRPPRRAARVRATTPRHIVTGGGSDANALIAAASPAPTSPTAPSATTSPTSASASPRWRGCSTSRSRCSTRRPREA